MYLPKHFEESRIGVLHELMRGHPLATLVVLSPEGLVANHIPLLLDSAPAPFGTLRGHVARANPIWRDAAGGAVLAIFHGPQAYVSPSWYPGKAENGRAVPTWNYAVVHAHGKLVVKDDPGWLRPHLEALTAAHEAVFPHPWSLADAPTDYIEAMIKATVGIEIAVGRLEGKWKTSQNQPADNRAGVVRGLLGQGEQACADMAALVAAGMPG